MEVENGNLTSNGSDAKVTSPFVSVLYGFVVPVLFGVVTLTGLLGNGLVIYVIVSRERMRTVTNLLLLNLAVADLAFVVVVPPFTAYSLAVEWWPFGDLACRLLHYLVNVTAYVTVYTLVAVAVMRYLTVVHGASTARYRTPGVTARVIAAIWIILSLLNAPVILSYSVQPLNNGLPDCDINSFQAGRRLFATFFAFGYALPLAVIGVFSVCVLVSIRRQRTCASAGVRRTKSFRRKQAVGRLLILVIALFAVLWLPVHIHLLVAFFGNISTAPWYLALSVIWQCLAYSNSCVNPIIYNHTSKDFRDAFRCTFWACLGRNRRRRGRGSTECEHAAVIEVTSRGGAFAGSARSAMAQRRSSVPPADYCVGGPESEERPMPLNPVDGMDRLSDCSNRVHLED